MVPSTRRSLVGATKHSFMPAISESTFGRSIPRTISISPAVSVKRGRKVLLGAIGRSTGSKVLLFTPRTTCCRAMKSRFPVQSPMRVVLAACSVAGATERGRRSRSFLVQRRKNTSLPSPSSRYELRTRTGRCPLPPSGPSSRRIARSRGPRTSWPWPVARLWWQHARRSSRTPRRSTRTSRACGTPAPTATPCFSSRSGPLFVFCSYEKRAQLHARRSLRFAHDPRSTRWTHSTWFPGSARAGPGHSHPVARHPRRTGTGSRHPMPNEARSDREGRSRCCRSSGRPPTSRTTAERHLALPRGRNHSPSGSACTASTRRDPIQERRHAVGHPNASSPRPREREANHRAHFSRAPRSFAPAIPNGRARTLQNEGSARSPCSQDSRRSLLLPVGVDVEYQAGVQMSHFADKVSGKVEASVRARHMEGESKLNLVELTQLSPDRLIVGDLTKDLRNEFFRPF